MRLSRPKVALSIIVSLSALVFPCRSQEKIKFPIAASSKTLGYGPLWVAWKQGFFDQQGLDAQVVLLRRARRRRFRRLSPVPFTSAALLRMR